MSSVMDFSFQKSLTIKASKEDKELVYALWPESFLGLYDMGFRSFERLFNHRPQLKGFMKLNEDGEAWREEEKMKRIVLSLQQTLALAVATFADETPDPENTPENFVLHLQEIGGLHRHIIPSLSPDHFELLFKLLPEVIADVVSSQRASGPLTPDERSRLITVWTSITTLMAHHFVVGWERRVVPKNPKFSEICRSEKGSQERLCSTASLTNRTRAASDATGTGTPPRRTPSRSGPHRSRTQAEISTSAITTAHSSTQSWLERGNSAPIALHDLQLEFQKL